MCGHLAFRHFGGGMLRKSSRFLSGSASCFFLTSIAIAGGHKAADFPLRVHIFSFTGASHFVGGDFNHDEGEGRANLYENGDPQAFEFKFNCPERLRVSTGYETYMARWKKTRNTLEMLLPEIGKPNSFSVCELKIDLKESMAYLNQNTAVPAARFKLWMEKAQYDPEHGKNVPMPVAASKPRTATAPTASTPPGSSSSAPN